MDKNIFHSVRMDEDKCLGCMNCIKHCPTEAIRVRDGKANIIKEKCIDCGKCIEVCPHHAKYAERERLQKIIDFKYTVALPAPSLYGQFKNLEDANYVLAGLIKMGFDSVFEVSCAAEIVSQITREKIKNNKTGKPIISSACPAVCRLISVSYPSLLPQLLDMNAPMEIAAAMARREAIEKTGLKSEEIGIFFITPCPAKVTAIKNPMTLREPIIDGAVAISDIYPVLVQQMSRLAKDGKEIEDLQRSGKIGVSWAASGGESAALFHDNYLAADGIENVKEILSEIENEQLNGLDFIELNACTCGCVGGALTAENPFIAKRRLQILRKYLPVSGEHYTKDQEEADKDFLYWQKQPEANNIMRLADNFKDAMRIMGEINELEAKLPQLDCGTCGAPSCKSLAEDIVRGFADIHDCMFCTRNEYAQSQEPGASLLREILPAPFRTRKEKKNADSKNSD